MSIALKLINAHIINGNCSLSLEDYKEEIKQKEQRKLEKIVNTIRPSETLSLSYEIPIQDKFIWSERAVDININSTNIVKPLSIEQSKEMTIERAYNKLKAIKIKGLLHNNNNKFTVENVIVFSYNNVSPLQKKDLNINTNIEPQCKTFNTTFTEPSILSPK